MTLAVFSYKGRIYIISLSTIPSRFDRIGPILSCLLSQQRRPEAVRLYIPKRFRRFPDWDGRLPDVPKGVEICRPEEDLGPATKVLFAARDCASDDVPILYCDDDRLYLPDWSRRLLKAWEEHPEAAVASNGYDLPFVGLPMPEDSARPRARLRKRAGGLRYRRERTLQKRGMMKQRFPQGTKPMKERYRASGRAHIAQGFGGVLIRSGWLPKEAFDIPPVMWSVDDVWLSGHLARTGHPVWVQKGASRFLTTDLEEVDALVDATLDGAERDGANRACAQHFVEQYGIWG